MFYAKMNDEEENNGEGAQAEDVDQTKKQPDFPPQVPIDNADDSQGQHSHLVEMSSPIPNDEVEDDSLTSLLPEVRQKETEHTHESSIANGETLPEPSTLEEPSLPSTPRESPKNDSQGKEGGMLFSSSPIPNVVLEMDDLDALLDEQDQRNGGR